MDIFYSDFQRDYLLNIIIASITRIRRTQTPTIAPTIVPTLLVSSSFLPIFPVDLFIPGDVVASGNLVVSVDPVVDTIVS